VVIIHRGLTIFKTRGDRSFHVVLNLGTNLFVSGVPGRRNSNLRSAVAATAKSANTIRFLRIMTQVYVHRESVLHAVEPMTIRSRSCPMHPLNIRASSTQLLHNPLIPTIDV